MIDPRNLDTLLHPAVRCKALEGSYSDGKGLGASPGAACGKIVFTAEDAEDGKLRGEKVSSGSSGDLSGGYHRNEGISGYPDCSWRYDLSCSRCCTWYGTCCVSGCGDISMDEENKKFDWLARRTTRATTFPSTVLPVTSTTAHPDRGRNYRRYIRPCHGWADKYRT